jgi:hypothetical protein
MVLFLHGGSPFKVWQPDSKESGCVISGYHLSRGGPIEKPALNQVQINLIARVADLLRSNTKLKNMVMKTVYQYALSHLK